MQEPETHAVPDADPIPPQPARKELNLFDRHMMWLREVTQATHYHNDVNHNPFKRGGICSRNHYLMTLLETTVACLAAVMLVYFFALLVVMPAEMDRSVWVLPLGGVVVLLSMGHWALLLYIAFEKRLMAIYNDADMVNIKSMTMKVIIAVTTIGIICKVFVSLYVFEHDISVDRRYLTEVYDVIANVLMWGGLFAMYLVPCGATHDALVDSHPKIDEHRKYATPVICLLQLGLMGPLLLWTNIHLFFYPLIGVFHWIKNTWL